MLILIALATVTATPVLNSEDVAACGDTTRVERVNTTIVKRPVLDHKGRVLQSRKTYKSIDDLYDQVIKS